MMSKTINVFKGDNVEDIYPVVPTQSTTYKCAIPKISSVNGDVVIDIKGASGLMKIKGFNAGRRIIDAYAICSAVGNANNVLRFYNLSAVSNSLSILNISCATNAKIRKPYLFHRDNDTIHAGDVICVSGAGTAVSNLRCTVVLKTIPA